MQLRNTLGNNRMATNEKFILEFVTKGVEGIDKAAKNVENLKGKVDTLATALLGLGFADFIKGAMEAADRIADFSAATNISIGSLKALESAMNAAGGSGKNLEKSVNAFYAAIETANQGSIQARDAFAKVGVSLNDLKNLSEAEILNKTLEGLAQLPKGAETAAVATQLLGRSWRAIDNKALLDALDPAKYAASEEATKKAADQVQRMEESYKNLQEGAIRAISGVLDLLGEHSVSVDKAEKLVTGLGIALGLAFGASVISNIINIGKAVVAFNGILKANAAIQAGILALQGPKGWVQLAGAAAAAGAAIYGINQLLDDNKEATKEAVKATEELNAAQGKAPKAQLASATDPNGPAKRSQELDAKQKAALESEKRIAQSTAEIQKLSALATASDLEKIVLEKDAAIAKAKEEIYSKTDLSLAQKAKEFASKRTELETKAASDSAEVRKQFESQLTQQKAQYAAANNALLGIEQTELQKVNDLIAQQPLKYKEIGDEMRNNARQQDDEKKRIEGIVAARKLELETISKTYAANLETKKILSAVQQERMLSLKTDISDYAITQAQNKAMQDYLTMLAQQPGFAEQEMRRKGRANELSKEQIRLADEYVARLPLMNKLAEDAQQTATVAAAMRADDQQNFVLGWEQAYAEYVRSTQNAAGQAATIFSTLSKGFEDAIVRFVQTGKLSFKDLANNLIADFARIQAKQLFLGLFNFAGGSIPGRAIGGPVSANSPYIVGEQGPELFLPRTSGTIIPNNQLTTASASTGANVTYNINAVDAASFRQMIARDPEFLYAVTQKGANSIPGGRR
jgi:lambda family phage tail tape measure protein